jgi:hypothetical protein
MTTTPWIKSSRSGGNGGDCVEVRRHDGAVEVRDSKDRGGPVLRVAPAQFAAWLSAARAGTIDPRA